MVGLGEIGDREMRTTLRWLVMIVVSLVTFPVSLVLFYNFGTWSFLPSGEAERWLVAAGFAGGAVLVVGSALAWWAAKTQGPHGAETHSNRDSVTFHGDIHGPAVGKGRQKNIYDRRPEDS
jgi:hypothetical protein